MITVVFACEAKDAPCKTINVRIIFLQLEEVLTSLCLPYSTLTCSICLVMPVPFLRRKHYKKGAVSSPFLKEGTGKHPAETRNLEARRAALF